MQQYEGSGSYGNRPSEFRVARQPTPGQYYDDGNNDDVASESDYGSSSGTEEDEGAEDEDEREERHTKIHLNEIDAPEWQKIVYDRQAWRAMVSKIDIYE